MVRVAIAGASSGIGRHVLEGIVGSNKHQVVALSRSAENPELSALGVQVVQANYDEPASLVSALQGVHTLISAVNNSGNIDLDLIKAAEEAGVKRFIPNGWAVTKLNDMLDLYQNKRATIPALQRSKLEWAIIDTGFFMNYFAIPTKGIGHLRNTKYFLDVENGTADIPGTGNEPLSIIRVEDVGTAVADLLDVERWPNDVWFLPGNKTTFNEVIAIAETVRGKKFGVKYTSKDDLQNWDTTGNWFDNFQKQFKIAFIEGVADFEGNIPIETKPMSVETFLRTWWSTA